MELDIDGLRFFLGRQLPQLPLCDIVGVREHRSRANRLDVLIKGPHGSAQQLIELSVPQPSYRAEWIRLLRQALLDRLATEGGAPTPADETGRAPLLWVEPQPVGPTKPQGTAEHDAAVEVHPSSLSRI